MFKRIQWNDKYLTISIYALLVIIGAIIFNAFLNKWDGLKESIRSFIHVLSPFFIGFFIAYILNPGVTLFENFFRFIFKKRQFKLSRALAILIMYLIVFGLSILTLAFIIPQIVSSITRIVTDFPSQSEIKGMLDSFTFSLNGFNSSINMDSIIQGVNTYIEDLFNRSTTLLSEMVPYLYEYTRSFTSGLFNIVLGFIIAVYVLLDKERFQIQGKKIVFALLPIPVAKKFIYFMHEVDDIFGGFIIGKAWDSLIIGFICFFGLLILRMPYALLISVIVGITNMIPYFGPLIGAVPGFVIVFINSPFKSLWFLVFILALQQFDGNILGPKILGDRTGLSPFWVIFSITLFGSLFQVLGMFLGVPTFAVIYVLFKRWVNRRLIHKNIGKI